VDSCHITVTVLTPSAPAQEALFDLLADVARSWGERHNVELVVAGRPSSDDGYRECVGCPVLDLLAENERLREALTLIAEHDSLLEANGQAFGLHAARRMQAQAAAALSGSSEEVDL